VIWRGTLSIAVFIISYGVFLVSGIPASWALAKVEARLQPHAKVDMVDIRGSVWDGSGILALREIPLGRLNWHLSPWRLVTGRIHARLDLRGKHLAVQGQLNVGSSEIELKNVTGRASLPLLARVMEMSPSMTGTVRLRLQEAQLNRNHLLTSARGRLEVSRARLPRAGINLGTITLLLTPSKHGVTGKIGNSGGNLALRGEIFLFQNGRYTFRIYLKPSPGPGQTRLTGSLNALLGIPGPSGWYRYSGNGRPG